MRKVADKISSENQNTQFVFKRFFPHYFIMWEIMVQLDRPYMTMWRMRIACWQPKATNTLTE